MKLTLLVLDADRRYLEKMLTYIDRMPDADIAMLGFTCIEETNEYLTQHTADILLVSDAFAADDVCVPVRETNCVKIVLSSTALASAADVTQRAVFKFQPIRVFLENVKDVYYTYLLNKCNVIAFGSPIGGCGASSLTVACATMLSQHSSVVYVNLEVLGVPEAFFAPCLPLTQGKLDALLAQKIVPCEPPLQSYAQIAAYCTQVQQGLYHIVLENDSINGTITTFQLGTLLHILKQVKVFDYIVLDLGAYFGDAALYQLLDTLVVPALPTETAQRKLEKLVAVLTKEQCDLSHCKVLYNNCTDAPQDALQAGAPLAVIPPIKAATAQGLVQEMAQCLQAVSFASH